MTQPDPGQFDLVPVVFEAYRPRLPMPGAEAEAEAIADALADFRARPVLWESGPRNYPATTVRLRDWEQRASRNSMLLWIGHGFSRQDEGSLYVPGEPRPDGLPEMDDELGPAAFADHLIRQAGHRQVSGSWAIVVIEACGAGRYVDLVHQHLNARNRTEGLLLVGWETPAAMGTWVGSGRCSTGSTATAPDCGSRRTTPKSPFSVSVC